MLDDRRTRDSHNRRGEMIPANLGLTSMRTGVLVSHTLNKYNEKFKNLYQKLIPYIRGEKVNENILYT